MACSEGGDDRTKQTRPILLVSGAMRTRLLLWIACPGMRLRLACTTAMRCRRVGLMSEPGISEFGNVALFLPFSCNQKPQSGTKRSKAARQVVQKTAETGIYRGLASACKKGCPLVRDEEAGGSNPLAPTIHLLSPQVRALSATSGGTTCL